MDTTNLMLNLAFEPVNKTLLIKYKDCYYHIAPNFSGLKICDFSKLFLDHKIYFQGSMTGIKKISDHEICSYMVYHHYYY